MLAMFNSRWQRHDGFGLVVIALLVCAAMVIGYYSGRN